MLLGLWSNVSIVTTISRSLLGRISSSDQQHSPYWPPSHSFHSLRCHIESLKISVKSCASLCISCHHPDTLKFSCSNVQCSSLFPASHTCSSFRSKTQSPASHGPPVSFLLLILVLPPPLNSPVLSWNVASSRKPSFLNCMCVNLSYHNRYSRAASVCEVQICLGTLLLGDSLGF